jgi:endonuclease YncB( thermonuclease family)
MDTPEKFAVRTGYKECYGQESSDFAEEFFQGAAYVTLEYDEFNDKRDYYGRILAHVWLEKDGTKRLYALEAIRDGYSLLYASKHKYEAEYKEALKASSDDGRGLHNCCGGERIPEDESICNFSQ